MFQSSMTMPEQLVDEQIEIDVQILAKKYDVEFLSCSVKTGENVNEVFEQVIKNYIARADVN